MRALIVMVLAVLLVIGGFAGILGVSWQQRVPEDAIQASAAPAEVNVAVPLGDYVARAGVRVMEATVQEAVAEPAEAKQVVEYQDGVAIVRMTAGDFFFDPNEVVVRVGDKVRFVIVNKGTAGHDLVIPDLGVASKEFAPGTTYTLEFVANRAGSFEFYCSIPGHKLLGMVGTLTVEG